MFKKYTNCISLKRGKERELLKERTAWQVLLEKPRLQVQFPQGSHTHTKLYALTVLQISLDKASAKCKQNLHILRFCAHKKAL